MAHLRLCKGAYDEPPEVAYQEKKDVDANMVRLIQLMLDNLAAFPGTYPAVASHDHRVINWVKAYAYHHQISTERFEFQMLYGIRRYLQQTLANQGYKMRVYIPYGTCPVPLFHAPPGRAAGEFGLFHVRADGWVNKEKHMSERTERLRAELTDAWSYLVSVAEQIGPEEALKSTENPLWNVHDLLGHLAGAERGMQATVKRFLAGEPLPEGFPSTIGTSVRSRSKKSAVCPICWPAWPPAALTRWLCSIA